MDCMAVATDGSLFCWSQDCSEEVWHSRDEDSIAWHSIRARQVSCGINHSLIVTEEGAVLSFVSLLSSGAACLDQIAAGPLLGRQCSGVFDAVVPQAVQFKGVVEHASAGAVYSLLVTSDGRVFHFGTAAGIRPIDMSVGLAEYAMRLLVPAPQEPL